MKDYELTAFWAFRPNLKTTETEQAIIEFLAFHKIADQMPPLFAVSEEMIMEMSPAQLYLLVFGLADALSPANARQVRELLSQIGKQRGREWLVIGLREAMRRDPTLAQLRRE